MRIVIDKAIFSLQKTGGISRYFTELINQIKKLDPLIQIRTIKTLPTFTSSSLVSIKNRLHNYVISNYLKQQTSGVFHSSYYTRYSSLKIPQIVTVYDLIYEKFPQYFNKSQEKAFIKQKKQAIQNADLLICISKAVKQDVIKHYQIPKNKLAVVHLGISPIFKPIKLAKVKQQFLKQQKLDKSFFLYVGRRSKYKNFKLLARAFAKIPKNFSVNLVCVGGGNFNSKEILLFQKLKITHKVQVFPSVSDKQLALFYNCAKAIVIPSLDEGFGLPLLEALACRCPVIVSDIPVFREIARSIPIFFKPSKVESINQAMLTVLGKITLDNQLAKGLEYSKHFTWKKTAEKTLTLYKQLSQN